VIFFFTVVAGEKTAEKNQQEDGRYFCGDANATGPRMPSRMEREPVDSINQSPTPPTD
jgi:hypothetical protein